MKTFLAVLSVALLASTSAKPAYNYNQPPKGQSQSGGGGGGGSGVGAGGGSAGTNFNFKQQNFRPSQPASNSGIFSVVQSPPLATFSQGPVSAPVSQPAPAAAPISLPAAVSANIPEQAVAPQSIGLPAPAQFAQQFNAPINTYIPPVQQPQQQQFAAPQQHQQQFSAPQQQQQQFAAPQQQQQQFAAPQQQQPQQQFVAPQQQQFSAPQQQQVAAPTNQYIPPGPQQQLAGSASEQQFVAGQPQYQPVNYQPQPQQQTIISKDIYIHSAPEEVEEIGNEGGAQPAGPIRKNYRIVFIKAPSQNVKLNLDALKRAQASNEEKTVIYVLSKKPDFGDIQSQLAAVQNEQKSHKPEVFFIKYKTQEEANRAQQEIQAQYDSLGGSTHISDEGVAPVTSVIGGNVVNVGGSSFGQQQQFSQQSFQKFFSAKKK